MTLLFTLIDPPWALRYRLVNGLAEYTSAKKVITGVPVCVHAPKPQVAAVASKVTFVVLNALDNTVAALPSMMIVSGSVVQLPVLPWGAVVSTTNELP